MCCITCVLNLPALRSQETFPRLSVNLTNEQCEYTQYLYKGNVVAKLCNKSIMAITISLRPELK